MRALAASCSILVLLAASACRDLAHFSTTEKDHFEGPIVQGSFVRAGLDGDLKLCLNLDADHLQDAPGTISSSDGRFHTTALRPVPQFFQDPLSTMTFGEGRIKNLIYAATPNADGGDASDVTVVVSLLQTNDVEIRLMRSAPGGPSEPIFGVFSLDRQRGSCSF